MIKPNLQVGRNSHRDNYSRVFRPFWAFIALCRACCFAVFPATLEGMNVGKRVVERRTTLGMNQRDLAMRADVTPATLRSLEQDRRWPQDVNRAKIEQALGWAPGSLEAIRDGGEPTELAGDGSSPSTIPDVGSLTVRELRAMSADRRREIMQQIAFPGIDVAAQLRDALAPPQGSIADRSAVAGATDSGALTSIRASLRQLAGMHGAVADVVRRAADERLGDVISELDPARRAQVVELAYRLLDEQEAEGEGDVAEQPDDLAARRDSNRQGRPILGAVDDDDPTAGIDPNLYAAHPRTEPLEEDNPTP